MYQIQVMIPYFWESRPLYKMNPILSRRMGILFTHGCYHYHCNLRIGMSLLNTDR